MRIHNLKIKSCYFIEVMAGFKRAELRKNDRDYEVGEYIHFITSDGTDFKGYENNLFIITHVLQGEEVKQYGLKKGYAILSIAPTK